MKFKKDFGVYIKDNDPKRTNKIEKLKLLALSSTGLNPNDVVKIINSDKLAEIKLILKNK